MDIAAGERTEAARNLIDQAQDGLVELVIVTAPDRPGLTSSDVIGWEM